MAESIFKRLVAARADASDWHIASAGVWAEQGRHAASNSQLVMQDMGMDISSHQSQPVTDELVHQSDLILTMEADQKEGLQLEYPEYGERIYVLSEMVGPSRDINDPIGRELPDYQRTANELEKILTNGLENIIQLAHEREH